MLYKQKLARRVCTCAHLLVHVPRLLINGATQQIKQRHEETEIGLLLGVVDRVVPAASREKRASMHQHLLYVRTTPL